MARRTTPDDTAAFAAFQASRDEESFPVELVDRLLAGGNPIRTYREYRGLSLDQLATAANLPPADLSDLEAGGKRATEDALRRIAIILSVDLDDIAPA